jgi:hypothetical protein
MSRNLILKNLRTQVNIIFQAEVPKRLQSLSGFMQFKLARACEVSASKINLLSPDDPEYAAERVAIESELAEDVQAGPGHAIGSHDKCTPKNCTAKRPIDTSITLTFDAWVYSSIPLDENCVQQFKSVSNIHSNYFSRPKWANPRS